MYGPKQASQDLSLSFSLQEVAYGLTCGKPVVVIILDQEAWELLTVPGGAKKAWNCNKWGPPLSSHESEDFPGAEKFDRKAVARLFGKLAAINLCPCRPLEEANWGLHQVLKNMTEYVSKDIAYQKEHASLKVRNLPYA
eukprot:scaffold177739_cov25-Prasinocladus_malaysianus.AAC.2